MAKKPFDYKTLSQSVMCAVRNCSKHIKLNVVTRKSTAKPLYCYKHWRAMEYARRNR